MKKIYYIGMDVHKKTCYLTCFDRYENKIRGEVDIKTGVEPILNFVHSLEDELGEDAQFKLGYESGCLGTWLAEDLITAGYECDVMATSTIATAPQASYKKNDKNDSHRLAKALAWNEYKPVVLMDQEDKSNRDYIRYRKDQQNELKHAKQQMNAFLLVRNKQYTDGSKWTVKHFKWLDKLSTTLTGVDKLIFDSRLKDIRDLMQHLADLETVIARMADNERYQERSKNLQCLKGISVLSAMTLICEVGDFNRFPSAEAFSGYCGLVPAESSSSDTIRRGGITKAGNPVIRTCLIESTQSLVKGHIGKKGKDLIERQAGRPRDVITYADNAVKRLQSKFKNMQARNVPYNKAIAACARELGCFVWGICTNHCYSREMNEYYKKLNDAEAAVITQYEQAHPETVLAGR